MVKDQTKRQQTPEAKAKRALWRERNRQHLRDWNNARYKIKSELIKAQSKAWRTPERTAAHNKVKTALKQGRLYKMFYCQICWDEPRLIDAHHYNGYDKPLDVVWLCRGCHRIFHHGHSTKANPILPPQN